MSINKTFAYHKPSAESLEKITQLREAFTTLNNLILELSPNSRERSTAITQLETASMWAIKSIVFNDEHSEPELERI